jgi:hypothetical protein
LEKISSAIGFLVPALKSLLLTVQGLMLWLMILKPDMAQPAARTPLGLDEHRRPLRNEGLELVCSGY